jgi:hypothetical protein
MLFGRLQHEPQGRGVWRKLRGTQGRRDGQCQGRGELQRKWRHVLPSQATGGPFGEAWEGCETGAGCEAGDGSEVGKGADRVRSA